jgi:hypothetical protein
MVERAKIRLNKFFRYLINQVIAFMEILASVVPWSLAICTPYFYAIGTCIAIIVFGYFGALVAIIYLLLIYAPLAFVISRAIKHELQTQYLKYVDRWEGSEEKQKEALDYLVEAKRRKKD